MKILYGKFHRRSFILLFADILVIAFSTILSALLEGNFASDSITGLGLPALRYLPINIVVSVVLFWLYGLYTSVWTFASMPELFSCGAATVSSFLFMTVFSYVVDTIAGKPVFFVHNVSFYVIYLFLFAGFTVAERFSIRLLRIFRRRATEGDEPEVKVMIIGAGAGAAMALKEFNVSDKVCQKVVCIIDDNPSKVGKSLNGVPIVGSRKDIPEMAVRYGIDQIILAIPSITNEESKEILEICSKTNCKMKILPGVYQIVNGDVVVGKLRDVEIEDLLGRDPIKPDIEKIMNYVSGKVIMVTGGGGSIGSELCRQIALHSPKRLIIVDIYENNAYDIQQELRRKHPDLDLVVLIASVRNAERLDRIFDTYRPDIVYHAAAHKHVPLMEVSPNEALKNNVFGTLNTVRAADKYGVKRFVMISTDKAVNPTNVMGATKRICEMIIQTYNGRSQTEFVAVRFGNVLGSNGSVIPLFKKQIASGGPVLVTHPDIIRYFMTIPEAVSLVLSAGAYAKGGEIFVLDMGKPVRILDLATNLIRLSGYVPNVDIKIEFTGLRPGEKLFEELLMDEEGLTETENKLIFIGKPIKIDGDAFINKLDELYKTVIHEPQNVRKIISELVPTYIGDKESPNI